MKPQHQQDACVWLSSPFFHTAKTVEAAELEVIAMFWTFLQNVGAGVIRSQEICVLERQGDAQEGWGGELDLPRGWTDPRSTTGLPQMPDISVWPRP